MIVRINFYRTPTGCRLALEQGGKIGPTYHPFLARGRVGPFRFQESHGILGAIDGRIPRTRGSAIFPLSL